MKLLNIRITGTRPTADERDTARRVVQGDAAAMKALYDQSAGKLTATCARYVTDEDDLHDVLQEAYIKIFTRMDRFEYRGKGSLEAWMKRIAINEALKFLRGKTSLSHSTTRLTNGYPATNRQQWKTSLSTSCKT